MCMCIYNYFNNNNKMFCSSMEKGWVSQLSSYAPIKNSSIKTKYMLVCNDKLKAY